MSESDALYSQQQVEAALLAVPLEAFGVQFSHGITRDSGLMNAREEVAKRLRHELGKLESAGQTLRDQFDFVLAQGRDLERQFTAYRKDHP